MIFPLNKPITTRRETFWNGRKFFVSANFENESHSDVNVELQVTMDQPVAWIANYSMSDQR
jgi:hypothetical protein